MRACQMARGLMVKAETSSRVCHVQRSQQSRCAGRDLGWRIVTEVDLSTSGVFGPDLVSGETCGLGIAREARGLDTAWAGVPPRTPSALQSGVTTDVDYFHRNSDVKFAALNHG
jgi:hypothetical protein